MIGAIENDGPAAGAGLVAGDIVVGLDGRRVAGADDLIRLLNDERIGKSVGFDVLRSGTLRTFDVTPKERQ